MSREQNQGVKFPEVEVKLSGQDGNAFAIIGRVQAAMRRAKISAEDIREFRKEAMSGDYDYLLQTVMNTVTVC